MNKVYFNDKDFLGNKYPALITVNGREYKNNKKFIKDQGENINTIMDSVYYKFTQHPELEEKLKKYPDNTYFIQEEREDNILGKVLTALLIILKYGNCVSKELVNELREKKDIFTILSWNVNGIRSNVVSKGQLKKCGDFDPQDDTNLGQLIRDNDPDIICLQETKCDVKIFGCITVKGYYQYWNCSKASGARSGSRYSGTSIWTKIKPINILYNLPTLKDESEGRVIIAEFEKFILINLYSPNSGTNFDYRISEWDIALKKYLKKLNKDNKFVILCGDLNVSHEDIDVFFSLKKNYSKPKMAGGIAGFTKEERENFTDILNEGYIDTFRYLHPNERKYSWWNLRSKLDRKNDKGMRLDYFLVSKNNINCVKSSEILYESGLLTSPSGSDHATILLKLDKSCII
jgi:exodeoxyribonuclease-3